MRIAASASDQRHNGRALLYTPRDLETRLFLVKEGEVSLYHVKDGKRFVFDVMGPGTLFGNIGLQEGSLSHFAEAANGTRICTFSSREFQRIISAYPVVMMRAFSSLAHRLEDYETKLGETLSDAKEKILHEIERYEQKRIPRFLEWLADEPTKRQLTHEHLAKLTGLNRVTVTRAIHDLQVERKIDINEGGKITVHSTL